MANNDFNNNNTEDNMSVAIANITQSSLVPANLKDPYVIYELFEQGSNFDAVAGQTIKPIAVWFNDEEYKDSDTEEIVTGTKTYILAQNGDDFHVYSGFSVTMRIKMQMLLNVFAKVGLPEVEIAKVSKGMKQEYTVKPIRPAKK